MIKQYLIFYNFSSLCAWMFLLSDFDCKYVYIIQTFMILDVLHVLFGFVKSSFVNTFFQILSRLFIVWFVPDSQLNTYTYLEPTLITKSMVIAWSLAEIIRYFYYTLSLLSIQSKVVFWLRYSAFYVLYPIGIPCEWILIYKSYLKSDGIWSNIYIAILGIYFPGILFNEKGAYIMYNHMIFQRRKYLVKGKKKLK